MITVLLASSSAIAEDPCQNHVVVFSTSSPLRSVTEAVSDYSHALYIYYLGVCTHCGVTGEVKTRSGPLEDHSFAYTGGGRHDGDTYYHYFFKACTVCGYTVAERVFCPGSENGGCVGVMSISDRTPILQ